LALSSRKKEKKSFILELRKEGRINEEFLSVASDLRLEELIAVKLELSARMLRGKLYNFPLWYTIPNICRDALILFAESCSSTKSDMASILGISYSAYLDVYKQYNKDKNT
jgi:hypothetical protein